MVRHYSGGRYHCYQLAVALSELGYDVTMYVDRGVPFRRDFDLYRQPKVVIKPLMGNIVGINKHDMFIGLPMLGAEAACQLGMKHRVPSAVCVLDVLPLMQKYRSDRSAAMREHFWQGMLTQIQYSGSYVFVLADVNRKPAADWIGIPLQRVFTVYPAVNDRVIDSLPEQKRGYRCCFISRLEPHKKLPHAVDAVKPFGLHLDVITARPDYQLMEHRDMQEYVTFHVGVSDVEKFRLLKAARFLILPTMWEGFGMPIIEALACRTPAICYTFPTFNEVVNGSEMQRYVYFAKYGDRDALARLVPKCVREGFAGNFEPDRRFGMNRLMARLARILQKIGA